MLVILPRRLQLLWLFCKKLATQKNKANCDFSLAEYVSLKKTVIEKIE